MNPLIKRLPRDFRSNIGKYISIFLLLTATIMIGSGYFSVGESVVKTLEKNRSEYFTEDGQIELFGKLGDESIEKIKNEGLEFEENFYATVNDFDGNTRVLVFEERDSIDLPIVYSGRLAENENEIAVDRLFADNHGISVGDNIDLGGNIFTVVGTVALPDYSSLFKSNKDMLMDTTGFGVSVTTDGGLERFSEGMKTYRYSYRFTDTEITESEKEETAEKVAGIVIGSGAALSSFVTAENNQSISFIESDMGGDKPTMVFFVCVLVVIIAFVFTVLTNNTIEAEAPIIGTLRASGYKKSEIVLHYLSPTLIIAFLGAAVGNILGYTLMVEPFKQIFYSSYSLAPYEPVFSVEAFILTTVVSIVIMVLINWIMLQRKLSLSPLRFLRKDLKKGKQKRAVKLPNISFMNRFRLRVIIQNKSSYIVLFFGILLSSFLLFFGVGMIPLVDHYVNEIDSTLPYEYQYILQYPVEAEGGEKLTVYETKTYYAIGNTDISVTMMGVEEKSRFFSDAPLSENNDEIVLTSNLAAKLMKNVGDEITLSDSYNDKEYTFTVSAIYDYTASMAAFLPRETLNELLGNENGYFNSYVSAEEMDIDDAYIAKYITRADMVGAAKQMMLSFNGMLVMVAIFAILIYMILMYLLAKTVIERNAIHISFMKVFGYNNREIGKLYLNATAITVIVSLIACLPIEIVGFKAALIIVAAKVEGYISYYMPIWVYFVLVGAGLLSFFAVNALLVRKVRRIPMNAALKTRE